MGTSKVSQPQVLELLAVGAHLAVRAHHGVAAHFLIKYRIPSPKLETRSVYRCPIDAD